MKGVLRMRKKLYPSIYSVLLHFGLGAMAIVLIMTQPNSNSGYTFLRFYLDLMVFLNWSCALGNLLILYRRS